MADPYMPGEELVDDKTGNQQAKPRSQDSNNGIYNELSSHLNLSEITDADSSYWPESQLKPYNPDDLVRKRYDYSIYEDMAKDDQVSVCLQLKRDLILANGFDILIDSEDPNDILIKEELEKSLLEDPEISLIDSLEEIQSAYEFGFSISEKVFNIKDDGTACLKFIKTRHPVSWLLHTDTQGNVQRYEQRGAHGSVDIDPENLIHYKINPRFGNPYGRSDLRAAWEAWFIKKEIIKFYSIFLEKAASPTPVARYDKNMPQAAVDDIFNALKKLQTKTALAIPKDIELLFMESSNQGDAYLKGIDLFNMFIGRSLLVPDLLGFQGGQTKGGSHSLGKDQMNVFFRHINKRRSQIEALVNNCIIKPIVYYNYGEIDNCPRFKLKPMNDEEAIDLASLWLEAVKGHVYKPSEEEINHFRSLAKFPEGEVDFGEDPMQVSGQLDQNGDPIPPNQIPPNQDPNNPMPMDSSTKDQVGDPKSEEDKPNADNQQKGDKQAFARAYNNPIGDYDKKVNYKLIGTSMKRFNDSIMVEAKPVIEDIYQDLSSQIKKKRIIQTQSIDKFDSINLKFTSKLKSLLKKYFIQANNDAKAQARVELLKGNKFAAPLPDEDFLAFLEQESLQYIGDFEYTILKNARLKLIQAIKDGIPLNQVMSVLSDEGLALAQASLERYARTKFTEVMNRGRVEFFDSTGVVAAYQYSAILDDRTTDICEGLHGMIFEKGDEPIPPLHFNCRSLLIPITKYEDYKADKTVDGKNIDKFIEDNKGDGFSYK